MEAALHKGVEEREKGKKQKGREEAKKKKKFAYDCYLIISKCAPNFTKIC